LLVVLPSTFILVAAGGKNGNALAIPFSILEFANILVAICLGIGPLPVKQFMLEGTNVCIPVAGSVSALPMFFVIFKCADVFVSAGDERQRA
jgi:hypothetical protein